MFDVGFAELFLLSLIGLLVLGPERLPRVARTVGGFVRKARASWLSLRNTIQSELDNADISSPIKQAGEELKQISKDISDIADLKPKQTESPGEEPKTASNKDQPLTQGSNAERTDDV